MMIKAIRIRSTSRCGGILPCVAVAALALLAGCGPEPAPPAAGSPADGWYEFQGSWNGAGTRHVVSLGGDRRAALLDLTGPLLLAGPARPGVGFTAEVIALNDTVGGLTGRSVWTDDKGDQVYSEVQGEGVATGKRISGKLIGGTGRYAGATGSYTLTWKYVVEADDGNVQGRSVDVAGRVRFGTPPLTPREARP